MRHLWTEFDGWAASLNVDPLSLSYARFCNLAYHWITKDGDSEEVTKYKVKLWIPFKRSTSKPLPKDSPWSAENENASLSQFLGEVQAR